MHGVDSVYWDESKNRFAGAVRWPLARKPVTGGKIELSAYSRSCGYGVTVVLQQFPRTWECSQA